MCDDFIVIVILLKLCLKWVNEVLFIFKVYIIIEYLFKKINIIILCRYLNYFFF